MNTKRFRFDLATPADDAQLRRRMAEDWMRGNLSITFRREPSYFDACAVQGVHTQVIKCTDIETGEIIGVGSRSRRMAYINGEPRCVGYLSDLRAHPRARNRTLLARGYEYLRQLHEAEPVALYCTVIFDGNQAALDALVGKRAGLPPYHDFGRILTPAIHLDFPKREIRERDLRIEAAQAGHAPEILRLLQRWHSPKQFAPIYTEADFGSPRLRDLRVTDFLLAIRSNQLVGCCAAWDQRHFRQTHIERYSPGLAAVRPFYNFAASVLPLKPLPSPGSRIPYLYLSFVAAEENDVRIFRALLRAVYLQRRPGPWRYLMAGLHEQDPLAAALEDYRHIEAAGRLFVIHYPNGKTEFDKLESDRVPYLEIATL